MNRKSAKPKIGLILSRLKKKYPEELRTSLDFADPWQLMVATILSAQAQDVQVNKKTPALFKRYPRVQDYIGLKPQQLYKYTGSLGFYKNKSKNIVNAAITIHKNFNDKVPTTMEELITIPGVGRKTANVVLVNAFGKNIGIAIDTHCITVSNRLFLYNTENAQKIEGRLMEFVPKSEWGNLTHLFIALGRDVCTARRKYCEDCVLNDICPSSTVSK